MSDTVQALNFTDTLVAYFDIQGYSSFIQNDKVSFEKKLQQIKRLYEMHKSTSSTDFLAVKLHTWIISDSIILAIDTQRHPLFQGSVNVFLMTCSAILGDSMLSKFPLRGAIGAGNFYKSDDILLSDALVDAVNFEKIQDWYGVLLTNKATTLIERKIPPFFSPPNESLDYVEKGPVPIKGHGFVEYRYIKPFRRIPQWEKHCIPDHFCKEKAKIKIENSKVLYHWDGE